MPVAVTTGKKIHCCRFKFLAEIYNKDLFVIVDKEITKRQDKFNALIPVGVHY